MLLVFIALHSIPLPTVIDSQTEPPVEHLEFIQAFVDFPDVRKSSGKRHQMTLCLVPFTLAMTAYNR